MKIVIDFIIILIMVIVIIIVIVSMIIIIKINLERLSVRPLFEVCCTEAA